MTKYEAVPTAIAVTTPLKSPAPKGKSIIFMTQGAVPGVVTMGKGEKQAADAIGWNYSEINYDLSNPGTLQSALSTALVKHPTVVSITGADPTQIPASTVSAYAAAGIPIIVSTAASVTNGETFQGNAGGPESYKAAAQAVAAWFVADSKGKGNVVVANVQGVTILKTWTDAFTDQVKALCPACGVKVVPIPIAQAQAGGEPSLVVSSLRQNPSYKYVMFDDGNFSSGINSALSAAGLTDVKVGGSDFQPEQAEALRTGKQSVWTGECLLCIGYTNVDLALRWLEKSSIAEDSNPQPTQLLTKANIGTQNSFLQPADALAQYEKLWQVATTN